MKRWMTALSVMAALCISAATAQAGPACCKSKNTKVENLKAKLTTAVQKGSCSASASACAAKTAEFPAIERKFVVGDEIFDTEADAWEGLAQASEAYVARFTSIACVVGDKIVFCDEKDGEKCCKSADAVKATLASVKSGCCKTKGAEKAALASATCDKSKSSCGTKVAGKASCGESKGEEVTVTVVVHSDDEPECCKAKLPCCEKAKAEGKKGNCCSGEEKAEHAKLTAASGTCDKSKASCDSKVAKAECDKDKSCCKAKLASAEGGDKACCKAKLASLTTDGEKASCDKSKASCDSKVAKAECDKDKSCCKAKLASAEGGDKACCKAKLASLTTDGEKASCDKSKASCDSKVAKAECDKDKSCCKAKLASAEGGDKACCKAKLASLTTDGEKASCDKSKASCDSKVAKAECDKDKSCCKAKLASAEGGDKACCKAKLASLTTDGEKASCDKSKASCDSKVAKADGCCKSKDAATKTKLVDAKSCCDGKDVIYRVAGRDFKTWEEAVSARDAARAAIKKVAMSYVVDGKKVDCASKVCPTAKAAGKVKFVVGETTTSCELHARVELAKAQIDAAREALSGEKVATR
ncbi:MAG: hypothetical protein H6818_13590 [Phycisphaerales bacterium]|nr:hypothetical protein [Phycisphaerales bacterium]MCB9862165.1 hypothetical protein [Phycisphaerales bacterium]